MNLQKIYHESIGRADATKRRIEEAQAEITPDGQFVAGKEDQKPTDDAARKTIKIDWLNSTATKEMIESLATQRDSVTKLAIQKALTYHQHNNHNEIVSLLTKAGILQNIIDTYGNTSNQ